MININEINKEYHIYEDSFIRTSLFSLCVVKKNNKKYICIDKDFGFKDIITNEIFIEGQRGAKGHEEGHSFKSKNFPYVIFPLSWENYFILSNLIPNLKPTKCNNISSFGCGDRLGLVTTAHLKALNKYDVFPVIAQQSPRELEKEHRTFKSVLLDAVLGILEAGYSGPFGADADHIKSKDRLLEAIDAKYSMYTIDVSDELNLNNINENILNNCSKSIIEKFSGYPIQTERSLKNQQGTNEPCEDCQTDKYCYTLSNKELIKSACVFQSAMDKAILYHNIIKSSIKDFDFEVSIDEGPKTTTFEDHIFCSNYLKANNINFFSLAPKFPGKFQKALDYVGDIKEFTYSIYIHSEIARKMGNYKISLHSGSDKFSIYPIFKKATKRIYHIKTSGTSYLRGIILASIRNKPLFIKMYKICLNNLEYNKKFYDVGINLKDFPNSLENIDIEKFIKDPKVTQLFHISYGSILDNLKNEFYDFLNKNEKEHYQIVTDHIEKHLKL